jgi:hypothetical protein
MSFGCIHSVATGGLPFRFAKSWIAVMTASRVQRFFARCSWLAHDLQRRGAFRPCVPSDPDMSLPHLGQGIR